MMAARGMRGFGHEMMGFGNQGAYHYFNIGGMFMMLLFVALIGFLIYTLYKNNQKKEIAPVQSTIERSTHSEAMEILKLKLVNGEISEEEFTRKKELLLM